jgi:hypothetical protein
VPAADVGHRRPSLELPGDAVEGGDPGRDQELLVARAENALDPNEEVRVVLAPGHPLASPEGGRNAWLGLGRR